MRRLFTWGAVIAAPFLFALPAAAQSTRGCDFGEPAADASPEIRQFEFLIGNFRIEAHQWTGEAWSEGYLEAQWNGRWGLGGRAVIDEWFGPQFAEDVPRTFGANVRYFDPEDGRWSMVWQATTGAASVLEAEVGADGVLRMWQVYPEPASERRIYFEVYGPGHWARIDGPVDEEGTFTPQYKLEAFEQVCR